MILMIDNYDSFTYNLVQYLKQIGEGVEVKRNDAVTADEIAAEILVKLQTATEEMQALMELLETEKGSV